MTKQEKKFIRKFGEGKFCQFRRCLKLGLKNWEIERLTGLSEMVVRYWGKKICE